MTSYLGFIWGSALIVAGMGMIYLNILLLPEDYAHSERMEALRQKTLAANERALASIRSLDEFRLAHPELLKYEPSWGEEHIRRDLLR